MLSRQHEKQSWGEAAADSLRRIRRDCDCGVCGARSAIDPCRISKSISDVFLDNRTVHEKAKRESAKLRPGLDYRLTLALLVGVTLSVSCLSTLFDSSVILTAMGKW